MYNECDIDEIYHKGNKQNKKHERNVELNLWTNFTKKF